MDRAVAVQLLHLLSPRKEGAMTIKQIEHTWFKATDEPLTRKEATVPKTVLLDPFLIRLGPWIEVLEPADVRAEMA